MSNLLPVIFGSHLGNFEKLSDPLWLGWRGDDNRVIRDVCSEDLRKASNCGASATRLFMPIFELKVGENLWDLSKFDVNEIADTKIAIEECNRWDIVPWITMYFEHRDNVPSKKNVQGLRSVYHEYEYSMMKAAMMVSEFGKGLHVELICEPVYAYSPIPGLKGDDRWLKPGSTAYWVAKMIEKFWELGVPAENICYGAELIYTYDAATKTFKVDTTKDIVGQAAEIVRIDLKKQGWTLEAINKKLNAGWQTQHNCGRAPEEGDGKYWASGAVMPNGYDNQFCIDTWGKTTSQRCAIVSDDGAPQGKPIVSNPQPDGRWPRPNPQQEYNAAKGLLLHPSSRPWSIEVLGYKHNDEIYAQLEKVEQAVFEVTGQHSKNWHKFPDPIIPVECKTGETKTATCPDGSTIITHTCDGGKWKETGNKCPEQPELDCHCRYYLNIRDKFFGIGNFLKCLFKKIPPYCKEK